MVAEHIHLPDDGRGLRKVFVNGKEMRGCVYADTKKGIADCHDQPPKIDRWRKRVITRRYRGTVTIESMNDGC